MKRVYSIVRSFKFALAGVRYTLRTQRNMRIHFSAAAFVTAFGCFYGLSGQQWLALAFTITFVVVCEMFNTAVENAVNVATSSYHENAKIAKDVAAGAVFMAAVMALACAALLFCDISRLCAAVFVILSNGFYIGGFLTGGALAIWWILSDGRRA